MATGKRERYQEAFDQANALLPAIVFEEPSTAVDGSKPEGTAKRVLVSCNPGEALLLHYVHNFWQPDSDYVKDCALVDKDPLSTQYVRDNASVVRLHMKPYEPFQTMTVGKLKTGDIRGWMRWASENGRSPRRINVALSAMRVAIHRAISNQYLTSDPFSNVGNATEDPEERGILTLAELQKLIHAPVENIHYRTAVLLGALCGMRRGEIRGLLWGDIQDDTIDLSHNFVNYDGPKKPKRGSKRLIPLIKPVIDLLEQLKELAPKSTPASYVFESSVCPGKPFGSTFFHTAICKELERIGIPGKWHSRKPCPEGYVNVQEERNLTLHGMRHEFVTLARLAGVTDMEIQALAGHKDARMMAQYSHAKQVIDFTEMKKKLEKGFTGVAEKTEPEKKAAGGNQ